MNILLFGGFLGSGKTSVILQVAKYIVENTKVGCSTHPSEDGKPSLVIIENEVGETGIDDKILKAEGLSVRELFSGCICCTLNAELTICLNEIQETMAPQWVIIETTGMAFPNRIAETIIKYGKGIESLKIIVVVDAERWDELSTVMPGLIEGQIAKANLILINKIDCLEPLQLSEIEESVRRLNPSAILYSISTHGEIDQQILGEAVANK